MKTTRQKLVVALVAALSLAFTQAALAQEDRFQREYDRDRDIQDPQQQQQQTGQDRFQTRTTAGMPTKVNKASGLMGMPIKNAQNEKLGDIKDVVIDLQNEKVSYAVLSVGGVLGIGEKLLAVPLNAFTASPDDNYLVLNATKESVDRAEGFGKNWPSVTNPDWGAMPFWQAKEGQPFERQDQQFQPREEEQEPLQQPEEGVESEPYQYEAQPEAQPE